MQEANLHLYPSHFTHETRILKETRSLASHRLFQKIYIAALWRKGLDEVFDLDETRTVHRIRLFLDSESPGIFLKILKFVEWAFRVLFLFKSKSIIQLNCHSLSTLPIGVLFKWLFGARLIYDTHELETETSAGGLQKKMAKIVEKNLIRFVDLIFVVSQSIGDWYKSAYNRQDVHLVRNIPYRKNTLPENQNILKNTLGLKHEDILFIYQGALSSGRNVELLMDVFSKTKEDRHIVFMGFGELTEKIKEYARRFKTIHYHPAVEPEEVLNYTLSADIGVHLIENTCLNHYYCLPNKVFEYLLSGLPMLVSDVLEMSNLVKENDCGWVTRIDVTEVLSKIDSLAIDEISRKRINALEARDQYCWENEEEKMIEAYRRYFSFGSKND